jgi:multiple sugar transport system permease protein
MGSLQGKLLIISRVISFVFAFLVMVNMNAGSPDYLILVFAQGILLICTMYVLINYGQGKQWAKLWTLIASYGSIALAALEIALRSGDSALFVPTLIVQSVAALVAGGAAFFTHKAWGQSGVLSAMKSRSDRYGHYGYMFVAPFVLVFILAQAYPIFNTFYLAFTDMKGSSTEHDFIGFENFFNQRYKFKPIVLDEGLVENARAAVEALNAKDYNVAIEGIEEETSEGNAFGNTLSDFDVSAFDDPSALDAESDPFALDGTDESDPFALEGFGDLSLDSAGSSEEATPPTLYIDGAYRKRTNGEYIMMGNNVTKQTFTLRPEQLEEVKAILKENGIEEKVFEPAIESVQSGLVVDPTFWKAFSNTWILWGFNFIPQLGIALLLAVWFSDVTLRIKFAGFFKVVFYLPNIITAASVAILFQTLFSYPIGVVNQLYVQGLGGGEAFNFIQDIGWSRGIISFIQFWMWYGSTLIVLIAGITGIDRSYYESAVVDGATTTQMFFKITLPLLRPVMLYILVTSLIGGMQMFDIPALFTRDGLGGIFQQFLTTPMFIYNQAFLSSQNYSYAATASIGLFLLIMVFSIFMFITMRENDDIAKRRQRRIGK